MSYTVKSSEKLRKSGAEMETKAMLYLMNFHQDKDEVYYFVVDFFNDLTGMNRTARRLWDVQSKGTKKASPKEIGRELVTLYKNYVSDFHFNAYILFLGGVSASVRIDDRENVFRIGNIKEQAIRQIKNGLLEECEEKTYIEDEDINEDRINDFLNLVISWRDKVLLSSLKVVNFLLISSILACG